MRALADLTVTITESFPADYLHALTVEDVLASIAAPYAADFDLAAAEDDYRDALAANLAPLGVNVVGDALTRKARPAGTEGDPAMVLPGLGEQGGDAVAVG